MREQPDDDLLEAYQRRFDREVERAVLGDAIATGMGATLDGQHVPIEQVKVTSPEMAALAAKYITFDAGALSRDTVAQITSDVRSLAASVLAQAEGKRK